MNDVGSKKDESSHDAFSVLQRNYNDLLTEHARALIAVDQLRVAKYLARPRVFQDKGIVTGMETQTEIPEHDPMPDLDAAVAELEAQIEECVPLFTGNSDPVGDLQTLLQGLQSELAECIRNSDEVNCELKNRITDCEEKIRNMDGALSLKILDQNNSRSNSRANSRCSSRPRSAARGTSFCHTSSLISGADLSTTNSYNYRDVPSSLFNNEVASEGLNASDFEQEICEEESLTDILDMHNGLRAESEGSDPKQSSMWCLPVFSKKSKDKKPLLGKEAKKSTKTPKKFAPKTHTPPKTSLPPSGEYNSSKPPKSPRKPLSIKLRLFKGSGSRKSKQCISVVTEEPAQSQQYSRRSDSYRRSCSDIDSNVSIGKGGQKHTSDSALGSSVNVNRHISSKEKPVTKTRGSVQGSVQGSAQGSVPGSVSNLSVASSRQMMYCTPLIGSSNVSRASTPANGYDFKPGPGSYQNSDCGSEIQEILSRGSHSEIRQSLRGESVSRPEDTVNDSVDDISRRPPIRAKRSRVVRKERKVGGSGGYDSGYNEDGSRKSSPPRIAVHKSSPKSTQDMRSEISVVRDDVQELADRLRLLRSDMTSSRSSSPILAAPRTQLTRDALRDRLRRLQCNSPGSYEVGSRRSASPEVDMRVRTSSPLPNRSSSPRANRTYPAQLNRSSSPRLQRSSSPRLHRSSSPTRSSSPSTRHTTPRSPIIGYSRSPRTTRDHVSAKDKEYRDTRHLFYDRGDQGSVGKPPIEVGVRVGGSTSAAANFEVGPTQSTRTIYPIENANFQTDPLQPYDAPYCVSPTSGMETHFHFNFFGPAKSGEYSPR